MRTDYKSWWLGAWSGEDEEAFLEQLRASALVCEFSALKLARMLDISARHLQRLFSLRLDCSPQAWLNDQRLLVARQMLHSTRSVKEVAYSLGFRNVSQFSRDFRRRFAATPSSARAQRTLPAGAPHQREGEEQVAKSLAW